MSGRPGFLTVTYTDRGLQAMSHERKMVREKDVKFEKEDGSLEVTDVRIVWIKKPSRWGGLKKFGAVAGALAGAAALHAIGSEVGGVGGRALRGLGTGLAWGGVAAAISSWSSDSFVNKDKDGNTESIAVPVVAISQATQSGDKLVLELKSGGNMQFKFKQKKVIPGIIANVSSAQQAGKCPYCGHNAGGAAACPNCGAPLEPGAQPGTAQPQAAAQGPAIGYCSNCGDPYEAGDVFCEKCGHKLK